MRRASHPGIAIAVVGLAMVGCGDSNTDTGIKATGAAQSSRNHTVTTTSGSRRPLSQQQLVSKGDAICARFNARRAAVTIRSKQDYTSKLPRVAGYARQAVSELGRLTPPASMAKAWQQIMADHETIATDIAKLIPYAEAGNHTVVEQLVSNATNAQHNMAAIGHRYGFKECGNITD